MREQYDFKLGNDSFREYIENNLDYMGFKSSHFDTDMWMRAATRPDGESYY